MSQRSFAAPNPRLGLTILAGLALLLGACTSSSGSSAAASTAASAAASTAASTAPSVAASADAGGDASVLAAESDLGTILTDADGATIYYFANDTEGVSNCADDCLANWPPVEAGDAQTAGDGVTAELGTITRDDGTTQLTINGFPAYYFAGDAAAGDTNGQGVGEVWWVFGADGEPIEG
jgi:predicted lipoprotein with Yx(FWY)xxD motif